MAININAQSFVDAMVQKMQRTDLDEAAELAVESQFDNTIMSHLSRINNELHKLQFNDDGTTKSDAELAANQPLISYYEKRLQRYSR